ncbi:MAG: hypothetical protein ACLRPT_06960 [Akkermansia muciniphila]
MTLTERPINSALAAAETIHSLVKDIRHGSLNLEAVHLERPFPTLSHIHGTVHLQFRVSLISSAGGSFASSGAMERAIPNIAFIGSVL